MAHELEEKTSLGKVYGRIYEEQMKSLNLLAQKLNRIMKFRVNTEKSGDQISSWRTPRHLGNFCSYRFELMAEL